MVKYLPGARHYTSMSMSICLYIYIYIYIYIIYIYIYTYIFNPHNNLTYKTYYPKCFADEETKAENC